MADPNKPKRVKGTTLSSLEKLALEADAWESSAEAETPPTRRQPGRFKNAPEEDLGVRIQETRRSKNLTQGDLADLTRSLDSEEKGISRAVLSLYESGTNRPAPREIRLLCEALTVTPNYLIYGDNAPFHESNDYQRYGLLHGSSVEAYAWMAYVLANSHLNHTEAVMRLLLDLARGSNKKFDQGAQDKANALLLDMADKLKSKLANNR